VRPFTLRWEHAVAVGGVAAATLAVWLTLRAGFLAYPGWLASQKADFILGPIGVGLYWHYKRPQNRLGLMLIGLGLLAVVYILESKRRCCFWPTRPVNAGHETPVGPPYAA
jgi:hypothetical protein